MEGQTTEEKGELYKNTETSKIKRFAFFAYFSLTTSNGSAGKLGTLRRDAEKEPKGRGGGEEEEQSTPKALGGRGLQTGFSFLLRTVTWALVS